MGVLSMEELLLVLSLLPLAIGVDAFLGVEEPNPTGVCLRDESLPPPDLMLEDLGAFLKHINHFLIYVGIESNVKSYHIPLSHPG